MPKRRLRYLWIGILLALGGLIAYGVVRLKPHFKWRFSEQRELVKNLQPTPVSPMQAVAQPPGFARCHLGPLSFSVPAEMAREPEFRVVRESGYMILKNGTRKVVIYLPRDNRVRLEALQSELVNRGGLTSIPQLDAEVYSASTTDFRWTMSRLELERHVWLLAWKTFMISSSVKAVETVFGGELEGLLLVRNYGAFFEWVGNGGTASGMLAFEQKPEDFDLSWVRPICASLRYTGGVFESKMTQKELAELFRVE